MTLRTDVAELLQEAGIIDVDVEDAVADEHVRSGAYRRVVSVITASRNRDHDRAVVAAILRDPIEMVAKTAVVDFVDTLAMKSDDPAEFRREADAVLPELGRLETEGNREFIRRRIHDWEFSLSLSDARPPAAADWADVTDWMQRRLAETSASVPVLTSLAESGNTKKIRNIAKNRAGSRETRTH